MLQGLDGVDRKDQTFVSTTRKVCSVTELCRASDLFVAENLQMDGHSASPPEGGSCTMPRPMIFGRSRCKTARSLRIAFPNFSHGSAAPRARAHAAEPAMTTRIMRAHLMGGARTLSRAEWWFFR